MNNYQAVILFCGTDVIVLLIMARVAYRASLHRVQRLREQVEHSNNMRESITSRQIQKLNEHIMGLDDAYSAKIAELTAKVRELTTQGEEVERSVSRAFMRTDNDARTIMELTRALRAFAPKGDRR